MTDIDGDGNLDIYTTNHSAPESFLLGDGRGNFSEARSELGLDQDHEYPTAAVTAEPAALDEGIHVFFFEMRYHVRFGRLHGPVEGTIAGDTRFRSIRATDGIRFDRRYDAASGGQLSFEARSEGELSFELRDPGISLSFDLVSSSGDQIVVGEPGTTTGGRFDLTRRDRHGIGWFRDAAGASEATIVRGGLRGKIGRGPFRFSQEVFRLTGAAFEPTSRSAIPSGRCAADSVSWTRVGRGLPGMLIMCRHGGNSMMYRRDGSEWSRLRRAPLVIRGNPPAEFADIDGDGDIDVATAKGGVVELHMNRGARWVPRIVGRYPDEGSHQVVIEDFDSDGDMDILVAANRGSRLLVRTADGFKPTLLRGLGLPPRVVSVDLVDYDNDGDLDVFTIPGGLFERNGSGRLEPASAQPELPSGAVIDARSSWFDADGDGRLDLVAAVRLTKPFPARWTSILAMNRVDAGNWLHLDLVDPMPNPASIGASVSLVGTAGVVTRRAGAGDGARHSEGNHRIYFGLGSSDAATIEIRWPSGIVQHRSLASNRRVIVSPEGDHAGRRD